MAYTIGIGFCSPAPLRPPLLLRRASHLSRRPLRPTMSSDGLLVVGAGDLGLRVARQWRTLHADAPIVCATATPKRHESLAAAGFTPLLASEMRHPADHVVFCAPPGQPHVSGYADAVRTAASLARTRFVLTSTTGVLAPGDDVHENSPTASTERVKMLVEAENAAVRSGKGLVIRLAGLYSLERGAHAYWCRVGKVGAGPDGVLGLLHYEDAAGAVVAALTARRDAVVGQRFIATDGTPVSRKEIVDAAREHPMYREFAMPEFGEGGASKRLTTDFSRARLGWQPTHKSFVEFMREETREAEKAGSQGATVAQ